MRLQDISPKMYKGYYFEYLHGIGKYERISLEKSQYSYRLLYVDRGALDVRIGEERLPLRAGDVLYLVPGARYRLLPRGEDFALYNLFFDFTDRAFEGREDGISCVFLTDYDPRLRLPPLTFEDAPWLNGNGVFQNLSCGKTFETLCALSGADAESAFYVRAKLLSILAEMLYGLKRKGEKDGIAEEIIAYVRRNPNKELSGETLSRIFCYHKNYINGLVKKRTGKSLRAYIRYVKIKQAISLLLDEGCAPSDVAARLGYYDYSHFYKAFVAETGVSPTEYVARVHKKEGRVD